MTGPTHLVRTARLVLAESFCMPDVIESGLVGIDGGVYTIHCGSSKYSTGILRGYRIIGKQYLSITIVHNSVHIYGHGSLILYV